MKKQILMTKMHKDETDKSACRQVVNCGINLSEWGLPFGDPAIKDLLWQVCISARQEYELWQLVTFRNISK